MSEDELYYTDMPVGEILRRTRDHYGQSLTDIERALRIRASQIEAIESGDIEKLPGRVYAIGFVRSYAEYLGLDGNKMVHLFKIQVGTKTVSPELHFPVMASETKIPPVWLVSASLAFAFMLVISWWMIQGGDRSVVTEVPEVPASMKAGAEIKEPPQKTSAAGDELMGPPAPTATAQLSAAAVTTPATAPVIATEATATPAATETVAAVEPAAGTPAAASTDIILNIIQNSWVEIRDETGKTIVSRVLKAGDQYYVPDRPDLKMSLGNAGGVQLEVGGQKLSALGAQGQVRKNIPLDAEFLKKTYTKNPG